MDLSGKFDDALIQLADAHFALQQRLNEVVFLEGAKLFDPIRDMSLDPGDIQAIEARLFKMLEQYPEFKAYVEARKRVLPTIIDLMMGMRTASDGDWTQLIEREIGLELEKGVRLMAGKMGVSYGSKSYIQ